jgi:hypothetical protein
MAYLFITDEESGEYVDGTWEPNGGENAVILQPGRNPVPTRPLDEGPTLYRMVKVPKQRLLQPQPCEFAVRLREKEDIPFLAEAKRAKLSEAKAAKVTGRLDENKIGGSPVFTQGDEFPFRGKCRLLL